jgi:hypothetical protein
MKTVNNRNTEKYAVALHNKDFFDVTIYKKNVF